MSDQAFPIAAEPRPGQGGDEHVGERTRSVRERTRPRANAGMSRVSER